jgi:hypothetical protein
MYANEMVERELLQFTSGYFMEKYLGIKTKTNENENQ